MKTTILIFATLVFLVNKNTAQTVTDYDGNVYHTVTIGIQVWLKENLKVTHYRNGDSIPNITVDTQWLNLKSGAYCNLENNPKMGDEYGKLYNNYAVIDIRNICPDEWHVPSFDEWRTLWNKLGTNPGGKLKEKGTKHWSSPNEGATDEYGFTALPGRRKCSDGSGWGYEGIDGNWWSSTEAVINQAFYYWISYCYGNLMYSSTGKKYGLSVRCLRDTPAQINEINDQGGIKIYPNPATNKIYVNSTEKQDKKMQVFNTIGKCVLQTELNNTVNEIDISSLTKGIYILKIADSKGTFVKKIIKE